MLGDRFYEYGAGQYLVVSVDLPVSGNFVEPGPERPFLGFGLRLSPAAIAAVLLEAGSQDRAGGGPPRAGAVGFFAPAARGVPTGLAVSDADEDLIDAAVRLLRLIDRPADLPVLAPLIREEILWRLITGAQGRIVRQIGMADSSLSHIARSIHWIRDHYADHLTIEELARLSSMSVSSFHRHFRAVTAMTPIQFQKHIRLQEARSRLLGRAEVVADVGFAVGYDSASQFTREYRRHFGLPPGQDAARLRQSTDRAALANPSL